MNLGKIGFKNKYVCVFALLINYSIRCPHFFFWVSIFLLFIVHFSLRRFISSSVPFADFDFWATTTRKKKLNAEDCWTQIVDIAIGEVFRFCLHLNFFWILLFCCSDCCCCCCCFGRKNIVDDSVWQTKSRFRFRQKNGSNPFEWIFS